MSWDGLETAKRASWGQLLMKCARLFNERAVAQARAQGLGLRASHTALFPHIDLEGTRLVDLARRVGISKQAVAQLVDELEAMDVLKRIPDPADGRAKLICFARAERSILDGLKVLRRVEEELEEELGRARVDRLRATLTLLLDHLSEEARPGSPALAGPDEEGSQRQR